MNQNRRLLSLEADYGAAYPNQPSVPTTDTISYILSQLERSPTYAFQRSDGSVVKARVTEDNGANQNIMSEDFVRDCLGVQPRGYNGGPISTVAGPYSPSGTVDVTLLKQHHSKISIESVDQLIYEDLGQEYRIRGVIKAELRVPKPGHPYAFIAIERQPFHLAAPGSYGDALIGQARPPKPNEDRFIYWTFQDIQGLRKYSDSKLLKQPRQF